MKLLSVNRVLPKELGIGLLPYRVEREGILRGELIPFKHKNIKGNSFDEHSIELCYRKKEESEKILYLKNELVRFLDLWSKS
jgi:hypothetical protein